MGFRVCAWRSLVAKGIAAAVFVAPVTARGDDGEPLFRYAEPPRPNYLRTTLELGLLFAAGTVQYNVEQTNSVDWDLGYDWPSFRKKLTGEAVRFDTNRYDTNMLTHPAAGALYYIAARGNHLSIATSGALACSASALWEYIGEFREKASANDLIVTPIAGVAMGETTTQLGAFFAHGRKTFVTDALAILFAPSMRLHDGIDGVEYERTDDLDDFGLANDVGHAFQIAAGTRSTIEDARPSHVYNDVHTVLRTKVMNIDGYNSSGKAARWVDNGSLSELRFEVAASTRGVSDLFASATVVPLGWFQKDIDDSAGARSGTRTFFGASLGFDYAMHQWERARPEKMDQISGVHFGGLHVEHDHFLNDLRFRLVMDLLPGFSAVRSLAIGAYLAASGNEESLPTVVREKGYYYAWRATAAPKVEVAFRSLALSGGFQLDGFWGIEGWDRRQEEIQHEASLHDRQVRGFANFAWQPHRHFRVSLEFDRRARTGQIGHFGTSRDESSLTSSVGLEL